MAAPKHAENIRDYLVSVGLSDVTINQLNPKPINQYAVIEFDGMVDVRTHGSDDPKVPALDEGMVQVNARHTSAQSAYTNIHTIVNALDGKNFTVNSVVYTWIEITGKPRILERTEDGAVTYIAEFRVQSRR